MSRHRPGSFLARVLLTLGLLLPAALFLAAVPAAAAPLAHRDGCHRWHSCPSDTGSYVCGDLGYYSECPGGAPTAPPRATGSGSTSSSTSARRITQAVVATTSLKLRSGPGTRYSTLATYPRGTVFTYLGWSSSGAWVHVSRNGRAGWMMAPYLTLR